MQPNRRLDTCSMLRVVALASLLMAALVAPAAAHDGHEHADADGPVIEQTPADIVAQELFTEQLEDAPLEQPNGTCAATVEFEDVGDGCRTADGLLRIELPGGDTITTHGPDYFHPGDDTTELPTRMAPAVLDASVADVECVDPATPHTQLVYAIPLDGRDRSAQQADAFRTAVYELSAVIDNESRLLEPTSDRRLRVACDGGVPDIEVLRLKHTAATSDFATVRADLRAMTGGTKTVGTRRDLVFYDDHLGSFGGIAEWYDDEQVDSGNENNYGGYVALQDNSWGEGPEWQTLLHEAAHNMGAVQNGAPHTSGTDEAHCHDGLDVMCYDDGGAQPTPYSASVCAIIAFDCGHDDYFHPAPAAGSYLAGSWNVASHFNSYLTHEPVTPEEAAPDPPSGISASAEGDFIRLSWNASSDNGGSGTLAYRAYVNVGGTWKSAGDSWPGELTLDVDEHVDPNTAVEVRLTAYDRLGNESAPVAAFTGGSGSWFDDAVVGGPAPAAPDGLGVETIGSTTAQLRWEHSVGSQKRYYWIYAREQGTPTWDFADYRGSASTPASFSVTGLDPATTYEFGVQSVDYRGRQSAFAVATAETTGANGMSAPAQPVVSHGGVAGGSATATWDAVGGATSYAVYRSGTLVGITSGTSYLVGGLAIGGNTTIGVRARNAELDASPEGTTTVATAPQPDITPPGAPALTGWSVDDTISFSWPAVSGDVDHYRVVVGEFDKAPHFVDDSVTTTSYDATGLTPNTMHEITVYSVDAAGNTATQGTWGYTGDEFFRTDVDPADTTDPSAPGAPTSTGATGTAIGLAWTGSTDDTAVTGYRVYRQAGAQWALLTTTSDLTATATGLTPSTTYAFRITAIDGYGNESSNAQASHSTTDGSVPDTTDPSSPTGITASLVASTAMTISWDASTDNVGVTSYDLEQFNGATWDVVWSGSALERRVTGLTPSTGYSFRVVAWDAAGNASDPSTQLDQTTNAPDVEDPSAPTGLVASDVAGTGFTLDWSASTDDVGVVGYRVERSPAGAGAWTSAGTTSHPVVTRAVSGLAQATTYDVRVVALDAEGKEGVSSPIQVTTLDVAAPNAPTNVGVLTRTGTTITFNWLAATDNVGVVAYDVQRNIGGTFTTIASPTVTSVTVTGLASGTSYQFRVLARDAAGNVSAPSSAATISTLDTTAPTAPTGINASVAANYSMVVTWNASSDNVNVTGYVVKLRKGAGSFVVRGTVNGTGATRRVTISGLTAGAHTVSVHAVDAAANQSTATQKAVTVPDFTPPGKPRSPRISSRGRTSLKLVWGAATDNVRIGRYEVKRGIAGRVTRLSAGARSRTFTGLRRRTSYVLYVRAVDTSGRASSWVSARGVTT